MSGAVSFDPFAAAGGVPVAPPTNDNATSTPTPAGPQVSQELIPNYDANGKWSGYTRAADTPGSAPTPDAAPQVVAPPQAAKTTPASPSVDQSGVTAPTQETRTAAPTQKAKSAEFNPFAAAGGVPVEAAPPSDARPATASPIMSQEVRNQPWHQPITNAVQTVLGGAESLKHGMSQGLDEILDPLVPAIAKSLATGMPFTKAYDAAVQEQRTRRTQFESEHPNIGTALEVAGSIPSTVAAGPMFGTAARGAGLLARSANTARNIGAGAALGGAAAFTNTDGTVQQRAEAVPQGAEFGAALPVAASLVTGLSRGARLLWNPSSVVDPTTGKMLRETAGLKPGQPVPPVQDSRLPGMPTNTGEAFDNPGLATEQFRQDQTSGALPYHRAAQAQAIESAATQPTMGTRLASGKITQAEASESSVRATQSVDNVLRLEQHRLWNMPRLLGIDPDLGHLNNSLTRGVAALPQSTQGEIANSRLQELLDYLRNLKPGATISDINAARSDALMIARGARLTDPYLEKTANQVSKIILDSVESNPALRTSPGAWNDYVRARKFTYDMNDVLGHPQYQDMLEAGRSGNGLGDATNGLFNFKKGFEERPGGIRDIQSLVDKVRKDWGDLRTSNAGVVPSISYKGTNVPLDPAMAFAARADLGQGVRDVTVGAMLDRSLLAAAGVGDADLTKLNDVHKFIRTNRDALKRSGLFSDDQMKLWDAIHQDAIKGARVDNFQAPGSPTYRLFQGKNYLDGILGGNISSLWGPILGAGAAAALTARFGETGLASWLGIEAMAGGLIGGKYGIQPILEHRFAPVQREIMDRVKEAMANPRLAHDLMQKAGSPVSQDTKNWMRSFLAIEPVANMARDNPGNEQTPSTASHPSAPHSP